MSQSCDSLNAVSSRGDAYCVCCCQARCESTALRRSVDALNREPSAEYDVVEEVVFWRRPEPTPLPVLGIRDPDPDGVLVLFDIGVLSVEELLSVLFLLPLAGVEVFRGTPEPKPTGVGLRLDVLAPVLKLEVRRAEDPLLPSSESLSDTFDPCRLGGREPG